MKDFKELLKELIDLPFSALLDFDDLEPCKYIDYEIITDEDKDIFVRLTVDLTVNEELLSWDLGDRFTAPDRDIKRGIILNEIKKVEVFNEYGVEVNLSKLNRLELVKELFYYRINTELLCD